jgi:hypothetical protein
VNVPSAEVNMETTLKMIAEKVLSLRKSEVGRRCGVCRNNEVKVT